MPQIVRPSCLAEGKAQDPEMLPSPTECNRSCTPVMSGGSSEGWGGCTQPPEHRKGLLLSPEGRKYPLLVLGQKPQNTSGRLKILAVYSQKLEVEVFSLPDAVEMFRGGGGGCTEDLPGPQNTSRCDQSRALVGFRGYGGQLWKVWPGAAHFPTALLDDPLPEH